MRKLLLLSLLGLVAAVFLAIPGKLNSQSGDIEAAIQAACNRLVDGGLYKSCKPAPGFSLGQGYYSQSAQIKCECLNKSDNNKTIVTISLWQGY
ncbi:hypothetical protein EHQ53_18595 [Leptospira langatensis]|uniref:Uncharacterized protein n=1 Tax=Leptospira langatensis TaxID=2484983 RepID=A0A5F1ZR58_9LEPT|nr:hypothetical protein [Leptospira langatensis]TGK05622.1 hypothetical protein EHO57_02835 [Leptospira langatensis]TGL38753.1 hypothetical protein EHQ53_18595 [Leptospira langatensis]